MGGLFPAIIDTAIGVSTMMLVALGDKPARRTSRASTQTVQRRGRRKPLCAVQNPRLN
jgi:hypothetical protein